MGRLADDSAAQEKWLSKEAKERGFKDINDLAERDSTLFDKLAELWRRQHPAKALLSRGGVRLPPVSACSQLEADIARTTDDPTRAIAAG